MAKSSSAYEIITNSLITSAENWQNDWLDQDYTPLSLASESPYTGLNAFVLTMSALKNGYQSPWWGTFKNFKAHGGTVVRGSQGTPIALFRNFTTEDSNGEIKQTQIMSYFTLFNAEQASWENELPTFETSPNFVIRDFIGDQEIHSFIRENPKTILTEELYLTN